MVRVKGLRTLPVSGITSTDVLFKYEMVDFLQPIRAPDNFYSGFSIYQRKF